MSTPLLVRHPPPFPTESLVGHVLRLAEENGYDSPWSVYRLAGLKQNEIRSSGFKLEKLAAIINRPSSELESIGYSAPLNQPRWARLLGHSLVPTDLNIVNPGLCPRCVAEKGFIEAHWHLALMVGCPIHQCMPQLCPKCGKRVRLFRRGLLECGCDGNLMECMLPPLSKADAALLAIIRRKVLGLPANDENPLSLPRDQLMAMNLRSMLHIVRALGRHRLIADGSTSVKDERSSSRLPHASCRTGQRISSPCYGRLERNSSRVEKAEFESNLSRFTMLCSRTAPSTQPANKLSQSGVSGVCGESLGSWLCGSQAPEGNAGEGQ